MNRERFIKRRRDDWEHFEKVLTKMQGARMGRWKGSDVTRLSNLYRSICYDLSLVQSREWGARLEQYLNDLVARGHNCLYRAPPRSLDTVLTFFLEGFPQLLRRRKAFFFVSLALFAVPFLIAMFVAMLDPVLAEQLVDRTAMDAAGKGYSQELYTEIDTDYAEQRSLMAGFYVWNNVGIAFRCFALGAFFGIGTVVTLLFNGLTLGAITGYIVNQGHGDRFFSFVISHGSFELTAIVVAGAAGLLLGWGMIHPGEFTRRESLRVHGIDSVKLASGAGFMLAIAALIEGYFSPLAIPNMVKYIIGTMSWILVFVYLVYSGRTSGVGLLPAANQSSSGQAVSQPGAEGWHEG